MKKQFLGAYIHKSHMSGRNIWINFEARPQQYIRHIILFKNAAI
jgi:hypothetical protein